MTYLPFTMRQRGGYGFTSELNQLSELMRLHFSLGPLLSYSHSCKIGGHSYNFSVLLAIIWLKKPYEYARYVEFNLLGEPPVLIVFARAMDTQAEARPHARMQRTSARANQITLRLKR